MDSGSRLGVSLYGLWVCATSDLPAMAARTAGANKALSATANDSGQFSRTVRIAGYQPGRHDLAGAATGRVYPYYDAVRDDLQNILAETTNNLYDCAQALLEIMRAYEASDTDAAAKLQ